jgi:hypothetical protein
VDAQAPKLLQNKTFWTPGRPNYYKTKHCGRPDAQTVIKQSIVDAKAPKLL